MWYLIVSIPDLCNLTYFGSWVLLSEDFRAIERSFNKLLRFMILQQIRVSRVCFNFIQISTHNREVFSMFNKIFQGSLKIASANI